MVQRNPEDTSVPLQYDIVVAMRQELRRDMRDYAKNLMAAQNVRIANIKDSTAEQGVSITNWSKWWRGIMITLLLAIVSIGGLIAGWWSDQTQMRSDVSSLNHKIEEIDDTVKTTKSDLDSFRITFEQKEAQVDQVRQEQLRVQLHDLSQAVTNTIKAEMRKSRRR